jgi:hypothetical protein
MIATIAHSQDVGTYVKEGTVELGGVSTFGTGFLNESRNVLLWHDRSTDLFTFSPYIGWFFSNDLEVGAYPFVFTTITSEPTQTYQQTMFLLSLSTDVPINAKTFFFVEGMLGSTFLKDGPVYSSKTNSESYFNTNDPTKVTSYKGGLATGAHTGFKYHTNNNAVLMVGIQYIRAEYNFVGSNYFGYDYLSFVAGFTVVL